MVRPHPPRGRVVRITLLLAAVVTFAVPTVAGAQTTEGSIAPTEAAVQPEPLVATVENTSVTLVWLDGGATLYRVERSADAGETFEQLAEVEGTVLTYTDADVAPGGYVYRVVADAADPTVAPSVEVTVVELVGPLPDPTEPPPTPSPEPDPTPEPGPVDTVDDPDPEPPSPPDVSLPGLPGSGGGTHGAQPPAVPDGPSNDVADAKPRSVRSAGTRLTPLSTAHRLRLEGARLRSGMTTVQFPVAAGPRPAAVAAPPLIPASVAAAVLPTGPVIAAPPVVTELVTAGAQSQQPAPSLLVIAFAMLGALAAAHAVRPLAARATSRDPRG